MESSPFQWFRTGDAAYAAMLDAMESARRSIRLETYTYAPGNLGERFRAAAVRARQRGVEVKILVDALGSLNLPDAFWEPLRAAGGQFRWFNPLNLKRLTFRDHRKLLVCDDQVAFVGGFNLAPEYEGDGVHRGWRDVGLSVTGGLAAELTQSFELLFSRADFQHQAFTRFRRSPTRQAIAAPFADILLSGPGRGRNTIKRALTQDLQRAQDIRIAAAYFVPTRRLRRAMVRAARRGGRVQLILPAKSDVPLAQLASHVYYPQLLRAGVEVYEYQPQVLHSKLLVIDQACYVGSSNLDARSLYINYELMLRLTHAPAVREARAIFAEHLEHSRRIEAAAWRASRTFWQRLREGWAHFLLARLDPLVMRLQLQRDRARRRALH